jgi:hypothetical protein
MNVSVDPECVCKWTMRSGLVDEYPSIVSSLRPRLEL